jgi:hypothetical protein
MRPLPGELLASLRMSLNDTIMPKVEDPWARYVGAAMDLLIQHLQLRLAGELDVLQDDSADMAETLSGIAVKAADLGARGKGDEQVLWASLADLVTVPAASMKEHGLADATAVNERFRTTVVDVMRWLDEHDDIGEHSQIQEIRDELYQLIRRQTNRTKPLVEPLFMSFGPTVAS